MKITAKTHQKAYNVLFYVVNGKSNTLLVIWEKFQSMEISNDFEWKNFFNNLSMVDYRTIRCLRDWAKSYIGPTIELDLS